MDVSTETRMTPARPTSQRPTGRLGAPALAASVAAAIFWLGYEGGAYGLSTRGSFAIAVWWVVLLVAALALVPAAKLPRAALATGGFLAAFAAFTGLSLAWAASNEKAFNELNRVCLYLGVYTLVVLVARRSSIRAWSDGAAVGLTAVCVLGLASRLFPEHFPAGDVPRFLSAAAARLSYPVDYWNALATLAALALPLLLAWATRARSAVERGVVLAPVPALAATIYLTSSRGGSAAAVAGVILFFAATRRRWVAATALALSGAGSAVAVDLLRSRSVLVDGPLRSALAESQGRSAAWLVLAACAATGLAYGAVTVIGVRAPRVPRGAGVALAAVVVAILVAGAAAAHPVRRFHEFKQLPPTTSPTSVQSHLLMTSGNGRWQLWHAAYEEFRAHPLRGGGAGSYESWWARHGSIPSFVLDAHSLYLETLGELGLIGLVLLGACFFAGVVAAAGRLRRLSGDERVTFAGLFAAFVAFALEAGIDWMWEVTAVGTVGFVCLALMTGAASAPEGSPAAGGGRRRAVRIALPLLAAVLIVAQAVPVLAAVAIRDSQRGAVRRDADAAFSEADRARRIQPWAASPYVQLALVEEQAGALRAARSSLADAIARDRSDWRTWLIVARVEAKLGHPRLARAALEHTRALNPRSPLFRARR